MRSSTWNENEKNNDDKFMIQSFYLARPTKTWRQGGTWNKEKIVSNDMSWAVDFSKIGSRSYNLVIPPTLLYIECALHRCGFTLSPSFSTLGPIPYFLIKSNFTISQITIYFCGLLLIGLTQSFNNWPKSKQRLSKIKKQKSSFVVNWNVSMISVMLQREGVTQSRNRRENSKVIIINPRSIVASFFGQFPRKNTHQTPV